MSVEQRSWPCSSADKAQANPHVSSRRFLGQDKGFLNELLLNCLNGRLDEFGLS